MNDVQLTWKGQTYTVKARGPNGKMVVGAKIEQILTLSQLTVMMQSNQVPHITLCNAYSKVLQSVGATATAEDVLDWLFDTEDQDEIQERFAEMLVAIMSILSPHTKEQHSLPLEKSTKVLKKA